MREFSVSASLLARASPQRADIEQAVAEIWRKTLRVEELDSESNFYELGGDSILMMNILARIRSELGIELDEKFLLFAPTLKEFCMGVVAAGGQSGEGPEPEEGLI
jgi:aryl carrier-like protein